MISCSYELEKDELRYNTLSEYDEEIKRINEILDNFKEYINNYPQEMGIKPTYISMKYLREELIKERKELKIKELRKKYKVVILTSRPKEQVSRWLNNNGSPSMKVTNRKIPAVAYIDDRAIQFKGNYKKVISRLKNFKPYWAKEYYRVYNIVTDETIALFNDIYDATRVCNSYQSQDVHIQRIPGELE